MKYKGVQVDYRMAGSSPKTSFTFDIEGLADNVVNTSYF